MDDAAPVASEPLPSRDSVNPSRGDTDVDPAEDVTRRPPEQSNVVEMRRLEYEQLPPDAAKRGRRNRDAFKLDPAMDDLINAKTRPHWKCCYRQPIKIYFSSDKTGELKCCSLLTLLHNDGSAASDHKDCHPELPTGCARCVINTATICCDGCQPRLFENFAIVDPALRPAPRPSRATIQKYSTAKHNMELWDDLHNFRKKQTVTKFGHPALKNNGPGMFMSNAVLQRIIDCAQFGKIQTISDLAKETRWPRSSEYGGEILTMILAHTPPPPPQAVATVSTTTQPLTPAVALNGNRDPRDKTTKTRVCSKCQSSTHIGTCYSIFSLSDSLILL